MSRRILLVWTDITSVQVPRFHLGIAAVAAIFRREGCAVELYAPRRFDLEEFLSLVERFDPDTVAYSSMTMQYPYVRQLAQAVKQVRPKILNIIGGTHASYASLEVLDDGCFDVLCRGEGEPAVTEIARRDPTPTALTDIANLWVKLPDGEIVHNGTSPLVDPLDPLPFADLDIFDYPAVLDASNGEMMTMGSRGCPYTCDYCTSPSFNRLFKGDAKIVRRFSPTRVVDEIVSARERYPGVERVYFLDDIFAPTWDWLEEFGTQYRERVNIPFRVLLRVECAKPRMLDMLKEAGCDTIEFGLESGSEWLRRHIQNRTMSNEQIREAFRAAREREINTLSFVLVGLPSETPEMIQETFDLLEEVDPNEVVTSIFYPFPGTKLYDICQEKGYLTDDWAEDVHQKSILNLPDLTHEQILDGFQRIMEQSMIRAARRRARGSYDFLATLDSARVYSPNEKPVHVGYLIKSYEPDPWLHVNAPAALEYDIEVPLDASLKFDHGLRLPPDYTDYEPAGCIEFMVQVNGETVFLKILEAAEHDPVKPWHSIEVDLSAWAGQTVCLRFDANPVGDHSMAFAVGWGRMHLLDDAGAQPDLGQAARLRMV